MFHCTEHCSENLAVFESVNYCLFVCFRHSLYNLPKSKYLALFVGVGAAGMGHAEPFAYQAFVNASTTGNVSADFSQKMYLHSPVSYCAGTDPNMTQAGIPAFFIQGSNDILFNLNEAFDSFECYR